MPEEKKLSLKKALHGFLRTLQKLFCSNLIKENERQKEQLERYLPSFRFTFTESISGKELEEAIRKAFPALKVLKIADATYDIVKWDELVNWLNGDSLSELEWIETINDCDDFAMESTCRIKILSRMQSKNFAYGEAWGETPMGYHAFCIAYVLKNNEKKIVIIEPQNSDTSEWKYSDYKPDFIKI